MDVKLQLIFYIVAMVCAVAHYFRPDNRVIAIGLAAVTAPLLWAALEAL